MTTGPADLLARTIKTGDEAPTGAVVTEAHEGVLARWAGRLSTLLRRARFADCEAVDARPGTRWGSLKPSEELRGAVVATCCHVAHERRTRREETMWDTPTRRRGTVGPGDSWR